MSDELQTVVNSEVEAAGYELVELRRGGSKGRPVLDVRIERRDGTPVTVEDCSRASRALEARLDAGGIVSDRYVLEVSSPGIERVLRHAPDWRRFIGKRANVLSPEHGGRFEAEIVAVEGEEGNEVVLLRGDRGDERRIPLAGIKEGRLAFTWQR